MEVVINRTGRRFHLPAEIAEAFIDSGLATQYVKPRETVAPPPATPQFHVAPHPYSGSYQIICKLPTGAVLHFDGKPEQAANGFKSRTWDGPTQSHVMAGPEPPAEIVAEYKQLKEAAATRAAREAVMTENYTR